MNEEEKARENFWLKAASWTFGLWTLMIPITGKMILNGQEKQQVSLDTLMVQFQAYREIDQTAMAVIKDRQDANIERVKQLATEVRDLKHEEILREGGKK